MAALNTEGYKQYRGFRPMSGCFKIYATYSY